MVLFVGRSILIYRGFRIVFMCAYGCVYTYVFVSACAHTCTSAHADTRGCGRGRMSQASYFIIGHLISLRQDLIEPGIHYVSTRLAQRPT